MESEAPATKARMRRRRVRRQESVREAAGRRRAIVIIVAVAAVLGVAYVVSLIAYAGSLDRQFTTPEPADGTVAVVLVPTAVDGESATVTADVLVFPAKEFLDGDVLNRDIIVSLSPTASGGVLVFPRGQVPSPQISELAAPGSIENYPFDKYQLRTRVGVDVATSTSAGEEAVPVDYEVFPNAAGWTYRPDQVQSTGDFQQRSVGVISRTGPSILIAVVFIVLILLFGIMSALVVVSVLRRRFRPEMSTASWLTAALFALISLRNSLPGDPPLGSWMDVIVYYWVVVVVMGMVVITITTLLMRAAANSHDDAPS